MWDIASEGADGHVVLVDATRPDTWADAKQVLAFFGRRAEACVLAVNRAEPHSPQLEMFQRRLSVPVDVPIVACDVTSEASARAVLVELFNVILDKFEEPSHGNGMEARHGSAVRS